VEFEAEAVARHGGALKLISRSLKKKGCKGRGVRGLRSYNEELEKKGKKDEKATEEAKMKRGRP
jgi:hypothetical protein